MVTIGTERRDLEFVVHLQGHSPDPLVCAAVSAYAEQLRGYLENFVDSFSADLESGRGVMVFERNQRTEAVFNMFLIGALSLADTYPHDVEVNENE